MGGGKQKQTTSEYKEIKLPAWVDQASQSNYARAQDVANRPYEAYGGPTVAGLAPEFYAAQGMLGNLDDYFGNYGNATNALQGVLNYNPNAINASGYTAAQLAGTNLDPYMNPYIENVENRAIDQAERSGRIAQRDIASDATTKKAFGGSRAAIQQAVQGAETTRGIGDLSARLRKEGYDTATANALKDVAARNEQMKQVGEWQQAAQIESERNKLTANQGKTQAAQQMTATADQAQAAQMNQLMANLGIGQISQEQTQREYDDLASRWQKQHDYPLEQLNILMSALGMSPYGHTETGMSTTTSGGGGGMQGMLGMLPMMMKMGAGLIGSDRALKTDIEKLGHDKDFDLPMYAYRYKGDPKTYPKTVGPMAQDVEKKYPQAVKKIGGKRVIDLTELVRA